MKTVGAVVEGASTRGCLPLSRLRAGERGYVREVAGPADVVHRLRELGLYEGADVEVIRGGRPCLIWLAGQRVGFRCEGGVRILVEIRLAS